MTDVSSSATGGTSIDDRGRDERTLNDDDINALQGEEDDGNDEDEDLLDVVFPVVDDEDDINANDGAVASSASSSALEMPREKCEHDEDAVLRCFYLSVDSHVDGVGDVVAFEAVSTTT